MPDTKSDSRFTTKEKLITAGVGAGLAIPTFIGLRKPWKKSNLVWAENVAHKRGQPARPHLIHRIMHYLEHGTRVVYIDPKTGKPLKGELSKLKNVDYVLGTPKDTRHIKVKHKPFEEAFNAAGGRRAADRMENKEYQARLFKNIPTVRYKGQTHEQLSKRFGGHYVIKEVNSYDSGGRHLFSINHSPKEIEKRLEKIRQGGKRHIVQADLVGLKEKNIYDRMGKVDEYRVHTMHGKVMPGTHSRWFKEYNVPIIGDHKSKEALRAEREVKRMLKRIPKKQRQNVYGFDVIKTKKHGYKVIESNPLEYDGIPGTLSESKSAHPLYKKYTGKENMVGAVEKSLMTGLAGSSAVGGYYYTSKGDKKR